MVSEAIFRSGRDNVEDLMRKLSSETIVNAIALQMVDSYSVFIYEVMLFE
jgi:hypothetical protein